MKEHFIRFTRNLAIISTVVAVLGLGWHFMLPQLTTPALPWLVLFFILTTFILYYILQKASEKKFNQFVNYFMAASVFKLLLLLTVLTIYIYFNRADAIRFAVTTCILYLIYTVFEVLWLVRINKDK